jgi:hypothetical protein
MRIKRARAQRRPQRERRLRARAVDEHRTEERECAEHRRRAVLLGRLGRRVGRAPRARVRKAQRERTHPRA